MNARTLDRLARCVVAVSTLTLGVAFPVPVQCATVTASHDDAFVAHDAASDVWSIGDRDVEFTIGFDRSGALTPRRMLNLATNEAVEFSPVPDAGFTVGGEHIVLATTGPMVFLGARADVTTAGVALTFTFEHRARHLLITRSYAAYPGTPTIETWTRIEATSVFTPVELSELIGWQMTLPATKVKWIGGLRSDSTVGELEPFEIAEGDVAPGETVELGSDRRSSEQYLPFIASPIGRDTFFGGIVWSGAWRIISERSSDGALLRITARFPESPSVSLSKPVDIPHTFFGLASPDTISESAAVGQFILRGLRLGRPYTPLVTYNTWFAHGTNITEDILVDEIDHAASLGVELFVVDAGWYPGAGRDSESDFESGLGGLTADPDRFPSGLASLADYTHDSGMRFGLWVEPERMAIELLAESGVSEAWLATHDGQRESESVSLICLSGAPARQWLIERLSRLIMEARPDYLKWDNNGWINCNRQGHDHGPNDGNFAHVTGLYDVVAQLRARFPDLLIENVSGGGNRLDFGMARITDAAWMDDKSWPSSHVRHNLEGLSYALPPAYLLSFVIAGGGEEIDMGNDLSGLMRSRMPGILGMTFKGGGLDRDTQQALAREIQRYKSYRAVLGQSSAVLLSAQAPVADGWDVIQENSDDGLSAVVFAFKSDASQGHVLVRPRGLRGDLTYEVQSADAGLLGSVTGDSLMQDGIELVQRDGSLAHVVVLSAHP